MGVKGLWRLLAPVGKPISLESLDGKILAVDVSIWLNKAAKGMRDKHGNPIYNAHLVLIFHRICKLLFYGVKPVFVFDGGVPELKKKTLKARKERRLNAETSRNKTKEKMLQNYLQTKALETVTGTKSTYKLNLKEKKEPDIFQLPSPSAAAQAQSDSSSEDDMMNEDEWLKTLNESHIQAMFDKPDLVDIDSEEFNALPSEVKHELLTEIKDSHRRRYRQKDQKEVELPEEANDFSSFQLKNLMKRGRITHQIDQLRREMNSSMTAQFIQLYGDDININKGKLTFSQIESKQYASNEKQRYILIKNINKKAKNENTLFKTSLDDDYIRFKEKEEKTEEQLGLYQRLERPAAKFQILAEANAKRKRFGSDSSDELHDVVETRKKICKETSSSSLQNSATESNIVKDDVEYMSSDSSSSRQESDQEDSIEGFVEGSNNVILKKEKFSDSQLPESSTRDCSKEKDFALICDLNNQENILVPEELPTEEQSEGKISHNVVEQQSIDIKIETTSKKDFVQKKDVALTVVDDSIRSPCSSTGTSEVLELTTPEKHEMSKEGAVAIKEPVLAASKISETIAPKSREELLDLQEKLTKQQQILQKDTQKQSRLAATLTSEMYQDVQILLQLFGIPYLTSPAEAEAQCAQLDYLQLTDGSVTDDSDVFLFGARRVYKNIFNQKKYAECYLSKEIEKVLYLSREKLIALAFLTGSDYTEGVQGIGSITAMEVLHEFSREKAKETLRFFKEWVKAKDHEFKPGSSLKSKLKNIELPHSFNSSSVWEAYLSPVVDTSDEVFEWGEPDIMAIKEFASEKFGWLHSRTSEMIQPVIDRLNIRREKQRTLKEYFKPTINIGENEAVTSKRLQKILQKMATDESSDMVPGVSGTKKNIESKSEQKLPAFDFDNSSYFEDTSIESDLLNIDVPFNSRTQSGKGIVGKLPNENAIPGPSKQNTRQRHPKPSSNKTNTISSNEKVQAKKVENLIKAAAESLKPVSPFIKMQHVNNIVRNKMFQQRKKYREKGRKQKQKTAIALMEEAEAMKSSSELKPLESSESDSD